LQISQNNQELTQKLTFSQYTITSSATITNSMLDFEKSKPPVRVLLLPDGASVTFPLVIEGNSPFFLEIGWLIEPLVRQRLIRRYNAKGEWESLTFVEEKRLINEAI
jgi:hypothetical protein